MMQIGENRMTKTSIKIQDPGEVINLELCDIYSL